jgi:pSer/pThr/pTyr-binding forkhead associated (FHA) protein
VELRYGKLILQNPTGPEHEFTLGKTNISMGRANTNDIIINDVRVSRSHARLDCGPQGVTIVDLGSSNGTRVNGSRSERATLKPGDTISLGSQQFKYMIEDPSEDLGATMIDTQVQLDQTMDAEYLPVVINETTDPGLVVFSGDKTWRFNLQDADHVTIGRDESCNIYINAPNVSRRHAEVQRSGNAYLLKDLGSANGTRLRGDKIDQHILQEGDVFRIGPFQILFKAGFQEQDLTMAGEALVAAAGRRTIIFVPGLMGSELWLGNERVWPNVKTIFTNPEIFKYPSDIPLEPRAIVDEVVIVPNLIKQDQYNRFGDYLVDELNYQRGVDYFDFPYDWRQDVRISARQLGEVVESIDSTQPLIIIGHSLGTMVTRYYIERLGGHKHVERVILMGGPHQGAVKGLTSMLVAPQILPFGVMGERLREIMMTCPTSYQIIPDYPVGSDQNGQKINFLDEDSWLDPKYHHLLQMGRDFRRSLKATASVPSTVIFGYGLKTISEVNVIRNASGGLADVEYLTGTIGDGSVLEQSAFLPGSEIHPVHQHHGTLFVDNDVKMRLKLELTRPY